MFRRRCLVPSVAAISVGLFISTLIFYIYAIDSWALIQSSFTPSEDRGTFRNGRYLSTENIYSYKGHQDFQSFESGGCYQIILDTKNWLLRKSGPVKALRVLKTTWVSKDLGCGQRNPNGAIIGVKKCGTDALMKFLNLHPSVEAAHSGRIPLNLTNDEQFFDEVIDNMGYTTQAQVTLVDQPGFFYAKRSQFDQLAKRLPRGAPLILLLRDPVKRAISDYIHELEVIEVLKAKLKSHPLSLSGAAAATENTPIQELPDTFEGAVLESNGRVRSTDRLIAVGRYIEHIQSLIRDHPQLNLLVLDGDLFAQDPYPYLLEVEQFLKIPNFFKREHFRRVEEKGFHCAFVPERPDLNCLSRRKGRRHPEVDERVITLLQHYYRPYDRELRTLLNKTYSWMQ